MATQRTTAGFCALFLMTAGCSPVSGGNRLSDREWDAIINENVRQTFSNSKCEKVKVVGAPGYYTCGGDQRTAPYIDHLFKDLIAQ